VLQVGPLWIAESQAIVEYLEEAFPAPTWPRLLPEEIGARARARQLMSWLRSSYEGLRRERPVERLIYRGEPAAPLSAASQRAGAEIIRAADRLGASVGGALFGSFSVVDVDLALALWRVRAELAMPAGVSAYVETVLARPSVREFLDHARPPYSPPTD
jgi:glutathione S-transferase